ncbi:hypothetical protein QBC38DRAFT_486386 [Podospora fimiseda]|uniref:C2H2-type domain-containing protein n=1 Tax=Podospora fimiseda TaxID=252190 RepID=A0AAN7BIG7_9PEZI|nr:hypothetical protein QBC38DRAFT_486386 [Podospora fimiseda]
MSTPPPSTSSSRMTCRRCTQSFDSRNKLMRHVFRDHSPPGSAKVNSPVLPAARTVKQSRPQQQQRQTSNPPSLSIHPPAQPVPPPSSSSVHPFLILSKEQQILFVFHVLRIFFSVVMKQHEKQQNQYPQNQQLPLPFLRAAEPASPDLSSPTLQGSIPDEQHHWQQQHSNSQGLAFRGGPAVPDCLDQFYQDEKELMGKGKEQEEHVGFAGGTEEMGSLRGQEEENNDFDDNDDNDDDDNDNDDEDDEDDDDDDEGGGASLSSPDYEDTGTRGWRNSLSSGSRSSDSWEYSDLD